MEASLAAGINPEGRPRWNVGPQQTLFAVSADGAGDRTLDTYTWGLLPSWAKDPSMGNKLFNARAETITEKPSFRSAFASRPCVIPVDGFYEWDHREGREKQPHYFTRRDGDPLLLAGITEVWRNPADPDAEPRRTCSVITTTPNDDMEGLHERMPVVLTTHSSATWLDREASPSDRWALLGPAPRGTLEHWGVSSAVGNVRNDGAELIAPYELGTLF